MDVKEVALPAVLAVGSAVVCFAAKRGLRAEASSAGPGEQEPSPDDTTVCDIGVFGMGVMGQNLALNAADSGFTVAAYNRADDVAVVSRLALSRLPLDWPEFDDAAARKSAFLDSVLRLTLAANEVILSDRSRLLALRAASTRCRHPWYWRRRPSNQAGALRASLCTATRCPNSASGRGSVA